jgi:hypothetical protein
MMVAEQNNWRSSPIGESCTRIPIVGDDVLDELLPLPAFFFRVTMKRLALVKLSRIMYQPVRAAVQQA